MPQKPVDLVYFVEPGSFLPRSSIEHGGTRTFSNIMALLTLFNEAPKCKSIALLALKNAYLWLSWPSLMRGCQDIFHMVDQYFGNDSLEPLESKFIGSTGLAMAYLWLSWPSLMRGYETIFQYVGIFIKTIVWNFCDSSVTWTGSSH